MSRILTCYYRPKPGGFCTRLFRAINALLSAGHEVHYLAVRPFPIDHAQCHFHRFPWPQKYTNNLAFWLGLHLVGPFMLAFLSWRYRISHLFAFGTNYGFLLQLSRCIKRIPLTVFLRSDVLQTHRLNHRPQWLIAVDQAIEGIAITGVRLYAVSRDLLDTTIGRHRVVKPRIADVLPNNLPPVHAPFQRATASGRPLHMACVGILEPLKNQLLVLDAMALLDAKAAHLYFYGDGPQKSALEARCRELGIQDRTHFLGWLNDTSHIWKDIDLLLFPSLLEGSPNTVLEAISNGVPLLASDIPAHREILPQDALLNAKKPVDWKLRIDSILREPIAQLDAMRRNQFETASRLQFDWDTQITTLILDTP